MKKVTKLKAYDFYSLHDQIIRKDIVTNKLSAMYKLLDNTQGNTKPREALDERKSERL